MPSSFIAALAAFGRRSSPSRASLSAPSGEQAVWLGRWPLTLIGFASSRMVGLRGMRHVSWIMPVASHEGVLQRLRHIETGPTGSTPLKIREPCSVVLARNSRSSFAVSALAMRRARCRSAKRGSAGRSAAGRAREKRQPELVESCT